MTMDNNYHINNIHQSIKAVINLVSLLWEEKQTGNMKEQGIKMIYSVKRITCIWDTVVFQETYLINLIFTDNTTVKELTLFSFNVWLY